MVPPDLDESPLPEPSVEALDEEAEKFALKGGAIDREPTALVRGGEGREGVQMLRILSGLAALVMASTTVLVASSHVVSPTTSSTTTAASVTTQAATTQAKTTGAQRTTAAIQPTVVQSATTSTTTTASVTTTGNGAPSGTHYNLNIIGVPHDKTAAMNDNNGHRIFVQLFGGQSATDISGKDFATLSKVNKIMLVPDTAIPGTFNVLDANATDSNGALFQLPLDVSAKWTVYARALGKPGGTADMTTCATQNVVDPLTGAITQEVICSISTLSLVRKTGAINTKFQNVTGELLFVTLNVVAGSTLATCLTSTGTVQVPLFSPCLQNYFWNYDNNGLKLLQLRFYPAG